jgi:hypothetical protein
MQPTTKFTRLNRVAVTLAGALLLVSGCLSTPRDFSSPATSIRIVDQNGAPMSGIEVSRNWYDSDSLKEGRETVATDQTGTSLFPKVPASVGLLTGSWRKSYTSLGMCPSGSGTSTRVFVRFPGIYDVVPKDRLLHQTEHGSQVDAGGVFFYTDLDSHSNTTANLSFPAKCKTIDYVLSAKRNGS